MKPLLLTASLWLSLLAATATAEVTLPMASPRAMVLQRIGVTDVSVEYHRPSVNGREVWGSLVPYGLNNLGFGTAEAAPWRAGANENTVFTATKAVSVDGQRLPAGRYGLHMIVRESGRTTVIFSSNSSSWGSYFYDSAEDVLRVDVEMEDAPFAELLTYAFTDVTTDSALLSLHWENRRIPIPLTVDTPAQVVASLQDELRSEIGFDNRAWTSAARYLLQEGRDLELALVWADRAVSDPFFGLADFRNLRLKADILEKLGRADEAATADARAWAVGTVAELHNYGRQLLAAGQTEAALKVFEANAERHPGQWPTAYGLARGYSALGRFEEALAQLQKAALNVPVGDTVNPPVIEANLEKLKRGEDIN